MKNANAQVFYKKILTYRTFLIINYRIYKGELSEMLNIILLILNHIFKVNKTYFNRKKLT